IITIHRCQEEQEPRPSVCLSVVADSGRHRLLHVCSVHRQRSSRARSLACAQRLEARGSRHYCRWPSAAVNRSHQPLARPASRAQGCAVVTDAR
ncbi:hypothetical protein T310_8992, partial [Rasamsonia emersonii CBS 393.64]